jgi:flagellar secretion chaperone FliS
MSVQIKNYHAADTLGRSMPELVIKVYDGAIGNLHQAREHYRSNNLQSGYESMEQVKKFIVHLYTTLDEEKGGEIADKLSKIYVYIIEQINIIQATKDSKMIDDAIEILNNIRDGWVQLVETQGREKNSGQAATPEQPTKSLSLSV